MAYCSNVDRECSSFYSNFIHHQKTDTRTHINTIVLNCLTEYMKHNSRAPSDLILLKNGSSKYDN